MVPIEASIEGMRVLVYDLGPDGVGLEHGERLEADETYHLTVNWRTPFKSKIRIRHSQLLKLADSSGPTVFHTGASFVGLSNSASVAIDSILIDEVRRKVTEWEANLTGARKGRLPELDAAKRLATVPAGFVWYRLVNGEWLSVPTRDPNQPIDGFAVRDDEDPRQIELLCKAYEGYDEEDRQMLRMMAHLAIASRPGR